MKLISCSTQLSTKFFLLINVKMPTIIGILTFMSGKNSFLGLSEPKKVRIFLIILYLQAFKISHSTEDEKVKQQRQSSTHLDLILEIHLGCQTGRSKE